MKIELEEVMDDVLEEVESAEHYAREAVKHKEEYPQLALCYSKHAERRLEDAESLQRNFSELMPHDEHDRRAYMVITEYVKRKLQERMRSVKVMLEMYRAK